MTGILSSEIAKLDSDWLSLLQPYLNAAKGRKTIQNLDRFLASQLGYFHPKTKDILRPLRLVAVKDVRLIIVGHYPYPQSSQTTGLPFSNPEQCNISPSVENIFKAIQFDVGGELPGNGSLEYLPPQGVLLLNRKFTTGQKQKIFPKGHSNVGWEEFSNAIIYLLANHLQPSPFLLWGQTAKLSEKWINKKHLILTSTHPSFCPEDEENPFLTCKHFSKANAFLKAQNNQPPISWLPN